MRVLCVGAREITEYLAGRRGEARRRVKVDDAEQITVSAGTTLWD
jgi:hypothetical protein